MIDRCQLQYSSRSIDFTLVQTPSLRGTLISLMPSMSELLPVL